MSVFVEIICQSWLRWSPEKWTQLTKGKWRLLPKWLKENISRQLSCLYFWGILVRILNILVTHWLLFFHHRYPTINPTTFFHPSVRRLMENALDFSLFSTSCLTMMGSQMFLNDYSNFFRNSQDVLGMFLNNLNVLSGVPISSIDVFRCVPPLSKLFWTIL